MRWREWVLGAAGVALSDVTMVINTHLHFDHIGGNRYFPGVPIVAQGAEFTAAQAAGFTIPEWVNFERANLRPVSGAMELAAGVAVMPTPSHTAGHQSVVVRTADSIEVIVGQALHDRTELATGASAEGLPAAVESFSSVASKIKALRPHRAWFSHAREPWTG